MLPSRKIIAGALAAVAIAGTIAATSTPASAQWRRHWGGWGGPAAAGVIGGLALGAIAGAAAAPYYCPPTGYYPPAGYYPYPGCRLERQPIYNRWGGFIGYRPVRVCY